ncbi:MAG TPA: hypothetical protein VGP07_11500 [Polyangia bacterium]|jgi:hypothetical protein
MKRRACFQAAGIGLAIIMGAAGGATAWAQAGGAGGASGAGGAGGATNSTPSCSNATMFPNPIIITGSSAFEPTASYFAVKAAAATTPVTIIYNATGSCAGIAALQGAQALTMVGDVYKTMDAGGKPVKTTCQIDVTPTFADVAISDVFYESCGTGAKPATIGDVQGPVQAMLPIVASTNTGIQAISAEQAAAIWGCGTAGKVGMFTDDTAATGTQQRNKDSGSQILMAKNIGVPADQFKGHMNAKGGDLLTSMSAGATAEPMQVIGFIAADAYKSALSTATPSPIHSLAFKGLTQTKAYYADSTATAQDRRNVRDGHYVVAGPEHMMVKLTNGAATAPAQRFIDWINGTAMIDTSPNTWIDLEAIAGTIPQCAMTVTHTSDGGFMSPYTPCQPCGCYFESKATGVAPAACVACSAGAPCAGGKTCSFGFCE